jgi:hypothetical protein
MMLVVVAARVLLGTVFAVAAAQKLRDNRAYRRFLAELLRPGWLVRPAIVGTILAEVTAAGLLLAPRTAAAGFGLALALLSVFSAALGRALRRNMRLSCGCLGTSSQPVDRASMQRNAALAAVAVAGLAGSTVAAPASLSTGAVAAGAVGLAAAIVVVRLDDIRTVFFREHA